MPPLAVPSSLVSTTPVTSTASANACAWRRPFWPVVASITISDSCGAPVEPLRGHAAHLRQLLHQVRVGVQAAGGVGDHHVGAARLGRGDRVEDDRAGVAARAARGRSRRRRARPRSRAARWRRRGRCRPRRRSPTARARSRRCQASLPIVVVLPVPLTPTTMTTAGRALQVDARGVSPPATSASSSTRRSRTASAAADAARLDLRLEPPDDLGGGLRADVGEDQRLLEPLPGLVVELLEEARAELGLQRLRGSSRGSRAGAEDTPAASRLRVRRSAVRRRRRPPARRGRRLRSSSVGHRGAGYRAGQAASRPRPSLLVRRARGGARSPW